MKTFCEVKNLQTNNSDLYLYNAKPLNTMKLLVHRLTNFTITFLPQDSDMIAYLGFSKIYAKFERKKEISFFRAPRHATFQTSKTRVTRVFRKTSAGTKLPKLFCCPACCYRMSILFHLSKGYDCGYENRNCY